MDPSFLNRYIENRNLWFFVVLSWPSPPPPSRRPSTPPTIFWTITYMNFLSTKPQEPSLFFRWNFLQHSAPLKNVFNCEAHSFSLHKLSRSHDVFRSISKNENSVQRVFGKIIYFLWKNLFLWPLQAGNSEKLNEVRYPWPVFFCWVFCRMRSGFICMFGQSEVELLVMQFILLSSYVNKLKAYEPFVSSSANRIRWILARLIFYNY